MRGRSARSEPDKIRNNTPSDPIEKANRAITFIFPPFAFFVARGRASTGNSSDLKICPHDKDQLRSQ